MTGPFGDPTDNKHSDYMVRIWLEKGLFETNGLSMSLFMHIHEKGIISMVALI